MFTLKIHTVDYPQPLHTTCTPTTSGGSAAGPNSNNNQKPVELMGVAHLFRQLPSANQPAVTVTNISARTTLIFVVAVPNYLSENDFLIFCGNHVSYFEEIIFLKVSALEDGARFVARDFRFATLPPLGGTLRRGFETAADELEFVAFVAAVQPGLVITESRHLRRRHGSYAQPQSVYFGVPILGAPLKLDQTADCRAAVEAGVGVEVMRSENGGFDGERGGGYW
ncbi:hypothetical protein CASFOL_018963 [Castilleja foliolosa]|uniref:BRCA1-associated 2/ETP1 RRM domain-containing protein n=1 Tax=Castilleja foliolosa TaxID=1961234 RepID=A0ABD3D5V6_9LAMI